MYNVLVWWDWIVNLINCCFTGTVTQDATFIINTNTVSKIKEDFFGKWSAEVAHALQIDRWWEWVCAAPNTHFLWLDFSPVTFDKSLSCSYHDDSYFVNPVSNRIKIIIASINTVTDALNSWEFALQEGILVTSMSAHNFNCPHF